LTVVPVSVLKHFFFPTWLSMLEIALSFPLFVASTGLHHTFSHAPSSECADCSSLPNPWLSLWEARLNAATFVLASLHLPLCASALLVHRFFPETVVFRSDLLQAHLVLDLMAGTFFIAAAFCATAMVFIRRIRIRTSVASPL
jgi:hypothetical protein